MRTSIVRSVAVWLVLPGYLFLLSADRRVDGSFAHWLDLTLSSRLGEHASMELGDLMRGADSVAEALKGASMRAAAGKTEQPLPAGQPSHESDALFTLLIGEWKQYRQVNTSTTPTEQPEIRDSKVMHRAGTGSHAAASPHDAKPPALFCGSNGTSMRDLDARIAPSYPPMASGMAMGAP